jgi:hypothetical protein
MRARRGQAPGEFPADGGGACEQVRAAAMNAGTVRVLFGHFTQQMLHWTLDQQAAARDYFVRYVRARGPAPVFRVGDVPYGVLPAVSLVRWGKRTTATLNDTRQNLEQQMLLDTTRRFIVERYGFEFRNTVRASEEGWSRDTWTQLGELGLLASARPGACGRRGQLLQSSHGAVLRLRLHHVQPRGRRGHGRVPERGCVQLAGPAGFFADLRPALQPLLPNLGAARSGCPRRRRLRAFDCLTPLANVTSTAAADHRPFCPRQRQDAALPDAAPRAGLDMIDVMVRTTCDLGPGGAVRHLPS